MLRDVMTIPNALAFARNYQIPNTKLSPPLLLHCGLGHHNQIARESNENVNLCIVHFVPKRVWLLRVACISKIDAKMSTRNSWATRSGRPIWWRRKKPIQMWRESHVHSWFPSTRAEERLSACPLISQVDYQVWRRLVGKVLYFYVSWESQKALCCTVPSGKQQDLSDTILQNLPYTP